MGDQTKGIQVGPCTDEGGGCRSRGLAPVGFTVRALRVISASRARWVMKLRRISSPRHDGLCLLWRRSDRWLRAPLDRQVRGASSVKSAMCGDRLVAAAAESSESDRSRIFPSSSKSRSFRARARSLGWSSAPTFEEGKHFVQCRMVVATRLLGILQSAEPNLRRYT